MADKDNKQPDVTSSAFDTMVPQWRLIDTVLAGTAAMRAAGETYLPRHEQETGDSYQTRLDNNVLLNTTEKTLDDLTKKPFSEPPKADEELPEVLVEEFFNDVDRLGNNLQSFCHNTFRSALAKGFTHLLIDMPKAEPTPDGSPRTLEDDRRQAMKPYWVHVCAEQVIFARTTLIAGREMYSHVRILECYKEVDGFGEVEKQQIRVLEPGSVTIWRPMKQPNGKVEWAVFESWPVALTFVPMVTFYAGKREGVCLAKPPLLDLAYLNVAHWQSSADQRHILRVARFPILACSGASKDDGDPVVIGPNKILYNEDAQGKFYYVEHTGTAIAAGRDDLKDIEDKMAGYGGTFLESDPGNPTATAKSIETAEETSALAGMVLLFEDAIELAIQWTADWRGLGVADAGGVKFVKQFSDQAADVTGLDALDKARGRRDISRTTYLAGLKKHGVLDEDFNAEDDKNELDEEMDTLMTKMDLNPGAPAVPGQPKPAPKPAPKK